MLDAEYFGLQVQQSFATKTAAAESLVGRNPKYSYSPNPLVEPSWIDHHFERTPLRWFERLWVDSTLTSTGPLFDVELARTVCGSTAATAGGVLEDFLTSVTDSTPLPQVDRSAPVLTWGEARAAALTTAAEFGSQDARTRPRTRDHWDADLEKAFLKGLSLVAPGDRDAPVVSIVMPVYNRAAIVSTAIESVLAQDFLAWELIVVDDGSSDTTKDVVRRFAERDDRVRLIELGRSGVSAARNAGIGAARGEILAFLDSDNGWVPHFLRTSVSAIEQFDVPIVYSAVKLVRDDERISYIGMAGDRDHMLDGPSFIDLNVLVLRRSVVDAVGGFDEQLRRWVDYDLVIRALSEFEAKYLPIVGVDYEHRDSVLDRITTSERASWRDVVLAKYLVDWDSVPTDRVPSRVSVLMHTSGTWQPAVAAIESVLVDGGVPDVEVVVVVNASTRDVAGILSARFEAYPSIKVVRQANNRKSETSLNMAFALSTGESIVVLSDAATGREPGWLAALVSPLDDESSAGAQALIVDAGGTVVNAGVVPGRHRTVPTPFLAGLTVDDVERAGQRQFVSAVDTALAVRASDYLALRGFDPRYGAEFFDIDFGLRLTRHTGRKIHVAHESVVVTTRPNGRQKPLVDADSAQVFDETWAGDYPADELSRYEAAGLEVVGFDTSRQVGPVAPPQSDMRWTRARQGRPVVARLPRAVAEGERAGGPSLRWAIKIASPGARRGDAWGDTFFAQDLAAALRSEGQDVVIDRLESHYRSGRGIDDVVVTIRGLAKVLPQPGAVNILWVISHPDLVTAEELRAYDLVYAAGEVWARDATERSGVEIATLLQATNPARFHPGLAEPDSGHDIVFVGTPRKSLRPIVRDTLAAGHRPAIFGHGWPEFVDASLVEREHLSATEVGAVYRAAGVVLNDHWADMAAGGFLSNRLFDAASAGARVVSDPVPGLTDVFGTAVTVVSGADELKAFLDAPEARPSQERLLELSELVRREHSFEARARRLVDDVVALTK